MIKHDVVYLFGMQFLVGAVVFALYFVSVCALFERTHDSVAASALFVLLVHFAVFIQVYKCFA